MSIVADFKGGSGSWVRSYRVAGLKVRTLSGSTWDNMNTRCKVGGAYQKVRPSYEGCYTSEMFKDFQLFTEWHTEQIGYGSAGYQLDKDLLVQGNKEYSETACVLIPAALNMLIVASKQHRNDLPAGVYFHKKAGKFCSTFSIGDKTQYLGLFLTPEEAHSAYVVAKEAEARRWANRLRDGEFIVDSRVIDALDNWRVR